MQRQTYIGKIPKDVGIDLLERMTTEQVEKLLNTNPDLLGRYGDYLEERLEAETRARRSIHGRHESRLKRLEQSRPYRGWEETTVITFSPQASDLMELPYRDNRGHGYYSLEAFQKWIRLFTSVNTDRDGRIILSAKEYNAFGLPARPTFQEFYPRLFPGSVTGAVENPPQEIVDYLTQEVNELDDLWELKHPSRPPGIAVAY